MLRDCAEVLVSMACKLGLVAVMGVMLIIPRLLSCVNI